MKLSFRTDSTASLLRMFDERIVAMWDRMHPELPVELSVIDHEVFKQEVQSYLTTKSGHDVLTWFAGNYGRFFTKNNLIMNISDVWNIHGYNDSYVPMASSLAWINDGFYFLPTSYYWWAIYYRPSILEEVGIKPPLKTWHELLGACDAFNAVGKRAIALGAKFHCPAAAWFDYLNMRLNGPEFHSALMQLKVPYTADRVKNVFTHWRQLIDRGCFNDNPTAYDEQDAVNLMVCGDAGMCLIGSYIHQEYADRLEDDLDFFRFPIINPDVLIGEDAPVDGYFIAANTSNPEGAKSFLAFLGSREVQQLAFDELDRLPTHIDVNIVGGSSATRKGIEMIQTADYVTQFYDLNTVAEIAQVGMNAFNKFLEDPSCIDSLLQELEALRVQHSLETQV